MIEQTPPSGGGDLISATWHVVMRKGKKKKKKAKEKVGKKWEKRERNVNEN